MSQDSQAQKGFSFIWKDSMKPLCYSMWALLLKVSVLTKVFDADAKKRRRRPKLRKADPIFRDRSTSPCLPLPPPLQPPPPQPVTTMASVVAASSSVYTMPRVFGPFPPLTGKPVSRNMLYKRQFWEGGQLPFLSVLSTALVLKSLQKGSSQTGFGYGLAVGQTDKRGLALAKGYSGGRKYKAAVLCELAIRVDLGCP